MINTIERARGRWREILPQLGIDTRFLTNKHGPCPLCGGRDRYRFDDKIGDGTYYCNGCGAGTGLIMIRKLKGWDHRTACDEIDKIIGIGSNTVPAAAAPNRDASRRRSAIERAISAARSPGVVDAYLARRGLQARSPVLLGDARCPYFVEVGKERQLLGHFPAVVAPILGPDGSMQSLHRIYDADLDPRKKTLPPVGTINGGAVRLFDPDEDLGIGEGIENSLAAHELFGVPVWAALTANGIRSFVPPPGLMRFHIFADNDADNSFDGQAAAFELAKRLRIDKARSGLIIEVHVPPTAGADWLDMLVEKVVA
ncbi:MAG: toprim domain-containing protein [Alphaproteobacteria bacterium]|nr:toprim domain-containing protein [Alphaproteobacteria bacterium]